MCSQVTVLLVCLCSVCLSSWPRPSTPALSLQSDPPAAISSTLLFSAFMPDGLSVLSVAQKKTFVSVLEKSGQTRTEMMEWEVKVGRFRPQVTRVKEEEEEVGRYMLVFISLIEGKRNNNNNNRGGKRADAAIDLINKVGTVQETTEQWWIRLGKQWSGTVLHHRQGDGGSDVHNILIVNENKGVKSQEWHWADYQSCFIPFAWCFEMLFFFSRLCRIKRFSAEVYFSQWKLEGKLSVAQTEWSCWSECTKI